MKFFFKLTVLTFVFFTTIIHASEANKSSLKSFPLKNIIDSDKSDTFVCHFGKFEIYNFKASEKFEFNLKGSGMMVNSNMLTVDINSNPEITYWVAKNNEIKNGDSFTVFCLKGKQEAGYTQIEFFVKQKK